MSLWDAIEAKLAELDEDRGAGHTPDPWATVEVDDPGLTDAQVAHLAGIEDQPPVPRLEGDHLPGD